MKNVDIAILYEKAARELDIACIIKHLVCQKYGLEVEIVQWPHGYFTARRHFIPRVVALPYHYQMLAQAYLYGWQKSIFVNLTWEQLFYAGNAKAKTPRGKVALEHSLHHAWSKAYADLLIQQGIPKERILLNGQPAYALYNLPYRKYFKQKSELASLYNLDPGKKWIFFPENYNWAFYSEAMLKQMIRDGQSPAEVYEMKEFMTRSFEQVIQWCEKLAKQSDVELIVRPRPATLLEDFKSSIVQVIHDIPDHFHVIHQETVRDWIISSDMVISSFSTSLIEASMAGKAIYMLEPFPLLTILKQDWYQLAPSVTSEDEFLKVCSESSESIPGWQLGKWAKEILMENGDPIENLADELARLCGAECLLPPRLSWQAITPSTLSFLPRWVVYCCYKIYNHLLTWGPLFLRTWYRRLLGRSPQWDDSLDYKDDLFSSAQIDERVRKWASVLNTPGMISD